MKIMYAEFYGKKLVNESKWGADLFINGLVAFHFELNRYCTCSIWIKQIQICLRHCLVWNSGGFEFEHIKTGRALFGCIVNPDQDISGLIREGPCLDVQKNQTSLIWILDFILPKIKLNSNVFGPKRLEAQPNHTPRTRAQAQPTDGGARARVWWFLGPMGLAHFAHNLSL